MIRPRISLRSTCRGDLWSPACRTAAVILGAFGELPETSQMSLF